MKFRLLIILSCLVIDKTIGKPQIDFQVKPVVSIGDKVAVWTKEDGVNPEELGYDIENEALIFSDELGSSHTTQNLWPNGIIPYVITGAFNSIESDKIWRAMDTIHRKTCIRFLPRTNEPVYVRISSYQKGCYSSVGYRKKIYNLNLQIPSCLYYEGTILHELLHAIGLHHEHSRMDRDSYVKVNWNNIKSDAKFNFVQYPDHGYHAPYNYASVMHYSKRAFSINGLPTLEKNKQDFRNIAMGQRIKLTASDIETVNRRYSCSQQFNIPVNNQPTKNYHKNIPRTGNMYNDGSRNSSKTYVPVVLTNNIVNHKSIDPGMYNTVTSGYANVGFPPTNTHQTQYSNNGSPATNTHGSGYYSMNTNNSGYPNSGSSSRNTHGSGYYSPNANNSGHPNSGSSPTNTNNSRYPNSGSSVTNTYGPGYYSPNTNNPGYPNSGSSPTNTNNSRYPNSGSLPTNTYSSGYYSLNTNNSGYPNSGSPPTNTINPRYPNPGSPPTDTYGSGYYSPNTYDSRYLSAGSSSVNIHGAQYSNYGLPSPTNTQGSAYPNSGPPSMYNYGSRYANGNRL